MAVPDFSIFPKKKKKQSSFPKKGFLKFPENRVFPVSIEINCLKLFFSYFRCHKNKWRYLTLYPEKYFC